MHKRPLRPSPNSLTVCEAPRTEETQPNTNMHREDCLATDSIEWQITLITRCGEALPPKKHRVHPCTVFCHTRQLLTAGLKLSVRKRTLVSHESNAASLSGFILGKLGAYTAYPFVFRPNQAMPAEFGQNIALIGPEWFQRRPQARAPSFHRLFSKAG